MQQGLKTANDLDELVAGLYISPVNGGGTAGAVNQTSIAIRGINAEGVGAAPPPPASTSTTCRFSSETSSGPRAARFFRSCSIWIASRCCAARRAHCTAAPRRAGRCDSSRPRRTHELQRERAGRGIADSVRRSQRRDRPHRRRPARRRYAGRALDRLGPARWGLHRPCFAIHRGRATWREQHQQRRPPSVACRSRPGSRRGGRRHIRLQLLQEFLPRLG